MKLQLDISKPHSNEIEKMIANKGKSPVSGYCIMADVIGSTAMKYSTSFPSWCSKIYHTFHKFHSWDLECKLPMLKIVGDELMYFVEAEANSKYADMFLYKLIEASDNFEKSLWADMKIAIAYCDEVYDVSFTPSIPEDYYGKGIDLTARLVSLAGASRIVCNDLFKDQLAASTYKTMWNKMIEPVELKPGDLKGITPLPNVFQIDLTKYSNQ